MVTPRAREAVARALAVEPNLAEVQTSLGFFKFWIDWDWPGAIAAFRRAIELDPGYPLGHRMLGVVLSHASQHDEAIDAIRRARELDPLYVMHQSLSSQIAFAARDYDSAVRFGRHAVVVDPDFYIARIHLSQAYVELGEYDLALDHLNNAGRHGVNTKVIAMRGYIFARTGRTDEALSVLNTLKTIAKERYVPAYSIAMVHLGLGQLEEAMQWLERGYEARDVHLAFLPIDAKWDPLRKDPRFTALLDRCNFPTPSL